LFTPPALGSLTPLGSVTQCPPQSGVNHTRLVPTASWFAAPFAIVAGVE
jgi:hypothetical protein